MMAQISINHRQNKYVLKITEKGTLALSLLQRYFPRAGGLSYTTESGDEVLLDIKEDELILISNITSYNVYIHDGSPKEKITSAKQQRLEHILRGMRTNKENKSSAKISEIPFKKKKIDKRTTVFKPVQQIKKLHVGWKHSQGVGIKFLQVKKPHGGVIDLELNGNYAYTIEEVIAESMSAFRRISGEDPFVGFTVKFGFFNDTVIEKFTDSGGSPCGIWEYIQSTKISAWRQNFYLLTQKMSSKNEKIISINDITTIGDEETVVGKISGQSRSLFESSEFLRVHRDQESSKMPAEKNSSGGGNLGRTHENSRKAPSPHCASVSESSPQISFLTSNTSRITALIESVPSSLPLQILQDSVDDDSSIVNQASTEGNTVVHVPLQITQNEVHQSSTRALELATVNSSVEISNRNITAEKQQEPENDFVDIHYVKIMKSQYSDLLSVAEVNKYSLHSQLEPDEQESFPIDEFDPLSFGYPICRVALNGRILLYIAHSGSEKRFDFPNDEITADKLHTILYGPDKLRGKCCEQYGVGMIPACNDKCNPTFTWYKSDQKARIGEGLYWISTEAHEMDLWRCEVKCGACDTGRVLATKKDSVTVEDDESYDLSIPVIPRGNFKISKLLLGEGMQGKVRKGEWLQTEVAVKSINYSGATELSISREIKTLDTLRYHPNLIQVMAICMDKTQVHIIMELFESFTLFDVLFDDTTKEEFNLDLEFKHSIGLQMCLAINYLHSQINPVYHCDIKPSNFLVNKYGKIKLCDLGLSKLRDMATIMRSRQGNHSVNGTRMYMAPELLLLNQSPTAKSDVWALACTLCELYAEKTVWLLEGTTIEDILNLVIERGKKPDLSAIPEELRGIISDSFNPEAGHRPEVSQILTIYTTLIN